MSRVLEAITRVRSNPIKSNLPPLEEFKPKIQVKEEEFIDENTKKLLQKLENLLKRIDDAERKLKTSENYLTNYSELQEFEKKFLEIYVEFDKIKQVDLEEIPGSLINRIKFRKEIIDRKLVKRR
ncbi:hypothetical protein HYV88_01745 [Candidatus Woesearchaeota archaeon]|nr:hypothetical protein [Candidatus Woesearchaeota archaeon]